MQRHRHQEFIRLLNAIEAVQVKRKRLFPAKLRSADSFLGDRLAVNGIRSCVQLPESIALSHIRLDFGLGAVARIR